MTIGTCDGWIANGQYGNTDVASSYGLPGQNLTSAYCRCDFGVRLTVEDDLSTYCSINGGKVHQDDIRGTSFPSYLWCRSEPWEAQVTNDNKGDWIGGPGQFFSFEMTKENAANGHIQYDFPGSSGRGAYIGRLDNFRWESETSGVGYVWVGGSAIYNGAITDPILVRPVQIAIPGLRELLDYFPWAIRKGGAFNSCNRSEGSLNIRKGGSWRECKNRESSDLSKSTAFVRQSGSWARCPKHGLNA